jgi:hypothetical protein
VQIGSTDVVDERKFLRTQNKKLSIANSEMRETMKARTTSLMNQRHKTHFGQGSNP